MWKKGADRFRKIGKIAAPFTFLRCILYDLIVIFDRETPGTKGIKLP
jgi:hypothetical protein